MSDRVYTPYGLKLTTKIYLDRIFEESYTTYLHSKGELAELLYSKMPQESIAKEGVLAFIGTLRNSGVLIPTLKACEIADALDRLVETFYQQNATYTFELKETV